MPHTQPRFTHATNRAVCFCAAAGLLMAGFAGCAKQRWPEGGILQGSVTIAGTPVSGGRVCASATTLGVGDAAPIDASGRYRFVTRLPVGEYRVWVDSGASRGEDGKITSSVEWVPRVPAKYTDEKFTPLRVSLVTGDNDFPITIEAAAGGAK